MLGSHSEAENAVREAWLRLARTEAHAVHNLGGWLTTTVSRICLDTLWARASRREDPAGHPVPDEAPGPAAGGRPERAAVPADSVGRALLVVRAHHRVRGALSHPRAFMPVSVCRLHHTSRDAAVLASVRSRSEDSRPTSSADRVLYRATDAILISS
ncbi:hypothetical protein ACFY1C_33420 [Streptomyces sp. NPDC001279]|uniref:hypothetical protein n=1 Tax=Streptomyces sp. NPDC001279 TaxID=3364556 RepID=UPI00368E96E7